MRMKTRIVVVGLAMGIWLAAVGPAFAASYVSGEGSAGVAQYLRGNGDVNPQGQPVEDQANQLGEEGSGGPANGAGSPGDQAQVQTVTQVTSGDSQLPFTGYAAIAVLLLGASLLLAGQVMRRTLAPRLR
jgi:hypothetical protein